MTVMTVKGSSDGESKHVKWNRLTWAVVANQLLWTAGYSLMAGGAISYFFKDLGASQFQVTLILACPELVGLASLSTSRWSSVLGSRRNSWLVSLIFSRLLLLALPAMAYFGDAKSPWQLWAVMGAYGISSMLQAISYTALLSWLADLSPRERYGRFFAAQELAALATKVVFLALAGWLTHLFHGGMNKNLTGYAIVFSLGIGLTVLSLIPLLGYRDALFLGKNAPILQPLWRRLKTSVTSTWPLLLCNLHLAFFQGLTQSIFFQYNTKVLGISMLTYNLLLSWLYVLQFAGGCVLGRQLDSRQAKPVLISSLVLVSFSLPCYMVASSQGWQWLIVVFSLWGGFVGVNLAYKTILLRLLPDDRQTGVAVFYNASGSLAGVSGILGGLWLEQLLRTETVTNLFGWDLGPFHLLMAISWIGRLTSIVWLIPLKEPAVSSRVPRD